MAENFTLEVELPDGDSYKYVEVDVEVDYSVQNNGIGEYEYWGCKGFDRGVDYAEIESVDWDKTGFSEEEIKLIESAIDKEIPNWEETIMQRVADRQESYPAFYSDED